MGNFFGEFNESLYDKIEREQQEERKALSRIKDGKKTQEKQPDKNLIEKEKVTESQ